MTTQIPATDDAGARAGAESFRAIFDLSPVATMITRAQDGRIVMANEACRAAFGHPPEQLVGRTSIEVGLWVEPERRVAMIEAFRREGQIRNVVEEISMPSGAVRQVLVSADRIEIAGEVCILVTCHDVTEVRELGRALRRSEERLRAFLENAPVLVSARDLEGRVLLSNPAFEAAFGTPGETAVAKPTAELVELFAETDRRVVSSDAPLHIEQAVHDAAGDERTYYAVTFPLHDPAGGVEAVGTIATDITELKRAVAALRESEERLTQVTTSISEVFILRELDPPKLLYVSPAAESLFGVPPERLHDRMALLEQVHPDDLAGAAPRDLPGFFESNDEWQSEFRIRRGDEWRWVHLRGRAVRDADGAATRLAATLTDVTEARAAVDALGAARARLDAVLDATSEHAVMASDRSGAVTLFNRGAERLLGYTAAELVGKPAAEVMRTVIDADEIAAYVRERGGGEASPEILLGPGGSGEPREWTFIRRDGSRVPVELVVTPIIDAAGRRDGVVGVARDLTEAKQRENELRDARARAEAADVAKSEFLSRMSHELRTPLHAILGFGQLLESGALEPDQRDFVRHITSAGRHLLELINEVLDLARIESGRLEVSIGPVPVAEVVAEAVRMLEPLAQERSVELSAPTSSAVYVRADRRRLKQVALNLLGNAVKYSRPGGVVEVAIERSPGDDVRVSVADSGEGIPAEDQRRLFEPFERIEESHRGVEGTGLGLALSKLLVERMGGRIGVDSDAGRRTVFWFELEPAVAPPAPTGDVASESPRPPVAGSARVLYVEDNPANRYLVERILGDRPGIELLVASDGTSGIELARSRSPDVILLDLKMADMSGEDVLVRLRADPCTAEIPVVIVSADATPDQHERLTKLGASGYLTKPFTADELVEIVEGGYAGGADALDAGDAEQVLDERQLAALIALDEGGDERGALAAYALSDAAERVEAIVAASAAGDGNAVAAAAHSLRASAAMLGARRLETMAAALERAGEAGSAPDVAAAERLRGVLSDARTAVGQVAGSSARPT